MSGEDVLHAEELLRKLRKAKKDVVGLSAVSSLLLAVFLRRILKPVEYLSQGSLRVYESDMMVGVERTCRKDELGVLQNLYADMLKKLKSIMERQKWTCCQGLNRACL